ncbi:uncharacterized protein [Amphiura filiformis]|uniref:uncharacterized protein n=1 Tax=Amphiura filiformis TaxID=82378 RepID=UPI003B21F078
MAAHLANVNVEKCFLVRITHKKKPIEIEYTLGDSTLQETKSHNYLGVEITNDLKWAKHIINNITAKANRSLGFIRRNLVSCPQDLKAIAYTTLVRPLLEYSSIVWDTHVLEQIKKIESLQRRAAQFVKNDYSRESSPSSMISTLGLDSLEQRKKVARVTMMHKIANGQAAIPERTFLQPERPYQTSCHHSNGLTND